MSWQAAIPFQTSLNIRRILVGEVKLLIKHFQPLQPTLGSCTTRLVLKIEWISHHVKCQHNEREWTWSNTSVTYNRQGRWKIPAPKRDDELPLRPNHNCTFPARHHARSGPGRCEGIQCCQNERKCDEPAMRGKYAISMCDWFGAEKILALVPCFVFLTLRSPFD